MTASKSAKLMAGVPTLNAGLYRRIRFLVGDPVAFIELSSSQPLPSTSLLILRDIEMERAKKSARVDRVYCPKDFSPKEGLSGDRETATAQATAECLRREGVQSVTSDRSLPLIYVEMLRRIGISVECDTEWGVLERRQKDEEEIQHIEFAQKVTETAMERACSLVANAKADSQGVLHHEGAILTSERMRALIDGWLLQEAFSNPESIVACGAVGADCHDHGHGPLMTEQPVIIDIFPRDKRTLYNGDCTRTVVHGSIPDRIAAMHAGVVRAKAAATAAVRAGVTGHHVHRVTLATMKALGFETRLPTAEDSDDFTAMTHGTGHGLGLEVHEPPLLADQGPLLIAGDVVTIEPGLYCRAVGGVRVEDMVVVTHDGCRNLNRLPEGLNWRTS